MLLEEALIHLIRSHDKNKDHAGGLFYSELLNQMNKIETTDIPTAGVSITDKINLMYNPHFWKSLSIEEQVDLLKHEMHHIMHDHISIFKEKFPNMEKINTFEDKLKTMQGMHEWNIAADLEINEYLPNAPKEFKIFDKDGNAIADAKSWNVEKLKAENPKLKIENRESMGYYYNFLKQNKDKLKKPGQGQKAAGGEGEDSGDGSGDYTLSDDHSTWAEGSSNPEEIKERIKNAVNKAAQIARGAGRLPGDIELAIERLNHKAKNWKQDLKKFIGNSLEVLAESSRKSRNRRFGLLFPGLKKYPKLHIGIAPDCSGSVSDEELCQFFAEIAKICNEDVKVTVIEFDAKVNRVYDFDPRKPTTITGRGGTMFQPVLDKADELGLDGLILLTDGDCFDKIEKPKYPVMWAILEGHKAPVDWGLKTIVTVQRK